MIKKLYKLGKKITISFFILYGYNMLVPSTAIIPINLVTTILITLFNIPALLLLIIVKLTIY